MKGQELCYLSVAELGRRIRARRVSPVEVAQAFLDRTELLEPRLNSFITLLKAKALAAARRAEKQVMAGKNLGPFHGIPVGLKDLYHTKGVRTTSGSAVDRRFTPAADCAVVERLRRAGAIVMGKLNMTEFAYDATGHNAHYGPARNPWDPERMTGGSSSGSGSAVGGGECPIAMGSDTGGSIRIPASLCGVVGLKPTYGLISRWGVTPLSWSMDHAGPLTRTVEDAALCLNVLAGYDARDPASVNVAAADYTAALGGGLKGLCLGIPKEYVWDLVDPQVDAAIKKAIGEMEKLGARVAEVSIPHLPLLPFVMTAILSAEAAGYHRDRVLSQGAQYDPVVRLRVEAGLFVPAADYVKAMRARALLNREFHAAFRHADLLVTPTVPIVAPRYGTSEVTVGKATRPVRDAVTRFTRLFNMGGFPAISVPCGLSAEGMPIGLQLAGRPFEDATVLRAAHAYEQATPWHSRRPTL